MASIDGLFGSLGFGGNSIIDVVISLFVGIVALTIIGSLIYFLFIKKKNWNIKVEYRLPRDIREDQQTGLISGTITKEWGKGYYDAKKGVVLVKRKGKKPSPMKPFDIKKYLSASNILTVIQMGADDYRPVLDESYLEMTDEETGEQATLLQVKTDLSMSRAWRNTFERENVAAFSFQDFLSKHGEKLVYGLIIMLVLVGQAIVITRLR